MDGLLLGLANGLQCLSSCAPVLVTFLLGGGNTARKNFTRLLEFLSGRLLGYLLFGVLAYCTRFAVPEGGGLRAVIFGSACIMTSAAMIVYTLKNRHIVCAAGLLGKMRGGLFSKAAAYPVLLGFLMGINLCPPFLLALAKTARSGTVSGSLFFFTLFFIGTSVYFLPLSFLGALKSNDAVKTVAKIASLLIALYYLCSGILLLVKS